MSSAWPYCVQKLHKGRKCREKHSKSRKYRSKCLFFKQLQNQTDFRILKSDRLLDNTKYQIRHKVFGADEQALRFHHQLVWIHPFPNGNGRHARLMADLLAAHLGAERFSWGQKSLTAEGQNRALYLMALKAADLGGFDGLFKFARS